jgi:hypothetical protein
MSAPTYVDTCRGCDTAIGAALSKRRAATVYSTVTVGIVKIR